MDDYSFEESWTKPTIKLGQITIIAVMIACFLPNVYLAVFHDAFPTWENIVTMLPVLAMVFASSWIIQPITFSAVFGTAGTYLAVLAGSMSQIRIPASLSAQDVVGTEKGSPQADVVSVLGIAGSIFMSVAILTVFIFFGAAIMAKLPENLSAALQTLIFPALFGTMFGNLFLSGKKIALIIFPAVWLLAKFSGLPSWALLAISVFGSLIAMRVLYKCKKDFFVS